MIDPLTPILINSLWNQFELVRMALISKWIFLLLNLGQYWLINSCVYFHQAEDELKLIDCNAVTVGRRDPASLYYKIPNVNKLNQSRKLHKML